MTKISKKTHPNVNENERKEILAKLGYRLKEDGITGKLQVVKKPVINKTAEKY
jgi:hypothetical protein